MKRLLLITLLAAGWVIGTSCSPKNANPKKTGRMSVFVSIAPQAYVLKNLVGDLAEVNVLVPPGAEPHTFEPTPKQLAALSEAKIYFRIAVPFENRLVEKLGGFKNLKIVNVSQSIKMLKATSPHEEDEHEEDAHGHYHEDGLDPHTWMSPVIVKKQAQASAEALCEIDPANKAVYLKNLETLNARLDKLNRELAEALEPIKGRTFYVFHPAFGYFAREYGLIEEAVEMGGKSPSLKHVNHLIEQAKSEGVKVIFVQPQFSSKAARSIAEAIGGVVVPIDPLSEDYENNMHRIASEIKESMK